MTSRYNVITDLHSVTSKDMLTPCECFLSKVHIQLFVYYLLTTTGNEDKDALEKGLNQF